MHMYILRGLSFRLFSEWMNVSWRKTPMSHFCLTSSWWSQTANNNSRGPASLAVPGITVMGRQLKSQSGIAQWWSLMVLMSSCLSSPGLQVSKFCFCSEDSLVEGLLQNQVHLFLTTDINEVQQVSHKGQEIPSVVYYSWLWWWRQLGSLWFHGYVCDSHFVSIVQGFCQGSWIKN